MMIKRSFILTIAPLMFWCLGGCELTHVSSQNTEISSAESSKRWIAGDHHVHSIYSARWNHFSSPPSPILGGDADNSTLLNAQMAQAHGLGWMVTTDHGGPYHSKLNLTRAYPDLVASRLAVPNLMQFYGMEFDTPGARHSTLMIPHSENEAQQLFEIEKRFNRREIYPDESPRDTNEFMLKALKYMAEQPLPPIVIVNHPSRTATDLGVYGKVTPQKIRSWQDTASQVVIGMTGLPGHQASILNPDGSIKENGVRAEYYEYPTMGGYDQMTAKLGGFWDSMLSEGRRWWITGVSDSHVHYTTGRTDFWPGEYAKVYVYAQDNYESLMDSLRGGHIFVTSGDLINELYVQAESPKADGKASIGDTLKVKNGDSITLNIRFSEPNKENARGQKPKVGRVDVIVGHITGPSEDPNLDTNPTTKVIERFTKERFVRKGDYYTVQLKLDNISQSQYARIRGTNQTAELEPEIDKVGEDPWSDLWFYSNPIFIEVSP